jgi:PAS domain S-box-containing protein
MASPPPPDEEAQFLREILGGSRSVVYRANLETLGTTFMSPEADMLLGFRLSRWTQPDFWASRLHPDDRERVIAKARGAIAARCPVHLEYRMIAADESVRWMRDIVRLLFHQGAPIEALGVLVDVTEQRQAEEQLRTDEKSYRQLFKGSPLPMWAYDIETLRFRFVNEAAERAYGYSREEFARMTANDLRPLEDVAGHREHLRTIVENRYYTRRGRHRKKDGTVIDVDVFHHAVKIDGQLTVIGLIHDVTEQKRLFEQHFRDQRQLREVGRRLVSLQETERRALAAELHDRVGQSLSALGIKLSLIESMLAPQQREAAEVASESRAILEETGRAIRGVISELRPAALNDYGLVAALQGLVERWRRRFGLEVAVHGADLIHRPHADVEAALFRIAQEAIANVAKHAAASRVRLVVRQRPAGMVLCIADNGRGFDPVSLQQPGKLSRWGLLMMRERADSVGARLRIRSAPGRGTRILVSWYGHESRPDPAR